MSLEFEEENFSRPNQPFFQQEETPKSILGLLFKMGFAKSKNQANIIIIILTIIFFGLSIIIFMNSR